MSVSVAQTPPPHPPPHPPLRCSLLIIRLLLLVAYCFLLVGGALGFPTWPSVGSTGKISLDGVIWCV